LNGLKRACIKKDTLLKQNFPVKNYLPLYQTTVNYLLSTQKQIPESLKKMINNQQKD